MISRNIKLITLYLISLTAIILFIHHLFYRGFLLPSQFLSWDAEHYYWIKRFGYKDFRVAFFPLFPLTWKFLHLNVYGIVLFNIAVFATAFCFLVQKLKVNTAQLLLYISIPSFCFFFVPYTEAMFFAFSVLLLFGLKDNKFPLVLSSLFLCTLTRPAFTVFVPALILMELFCRNSDIKITNRIVTYKIVSYIIVTLIGVLLVGLIQHYYTGEWFKFFEAQKGWGNHLQVPSLPLNSWGGDFILKLDGTALVFGLVSGVLILAKIFKMNFIKNLDLPREVFFSLCYLAGISLSVLLFRGGELFSLNRFVFATPIVIVGAHFYIQQPFNLSRKQLIIGFVTLFAFWLLLGSYLHIKALIAFLMLNSYLFLILLLKSKPGFIPKAAIWLLISVNFLFQVILLLKCLTGDWVG